MLSRRLSLNDYGFHSAVRLLQICPMHTKAKDQMIKQAQRKDKELVENLNIMERERPQELLEHIGNFSEECLDFTKRQKMKRCV